MIITAQITNKNIVKRDISICMRAIMLQNKPLCPPQRKKITNSIKYFRKRRWIVCKTLLQTLRRDYTRSTEIEN
jgi:hypothetical protein